MEGTVYINGQKVSEENAEIAEKPEIEKKEIDLKASSSVLSDYTLKFLDGFEKQLGLQNLPTGATVKVSEVLGGLARLYERIRTTVEYKGEHVLRRNAIERMLKRLIWEQGSVRESANENKISESLIRELIWARYLRNNFIAKTKIEELSKVVDKYLYFLKNLDSIPQGMSRTKVRSWIWGVASSEIEDLLDPSNRELYVNLMFDWFKDKFKWSDQEVSDHDKDIQIYLAIHRAHAKSDEPIMRYHLLRKEYPEWESAEKGQINKLILEFPKIYNEIENHLEYRGRFSLYRRLQKHSAAFDIFREIAIQEGNKLRKILEAKDLFEEKIRSMCEIKYAQIQQKVSTGIIRSIIYIFITKVVIAMLLEIPYEVFMYGNVRYLPLSVNIIFPPFMMWIIGMSTRIPGARNTEGILNRLSTVVYDSDDKNIQSFSVISANRNTSLSAIFGLIYLALFIIVFGGIAYLLTLIDFSFFGLLVFFFFLSLVILFGFRVRYNAVQLKIDSEGETFLGHIGSYLTLPFLNFGFYLSKGLAKINFLSVILDFMIEAPLKSIIEIFEEWTTFIKEKREEIIELPE